MPEVLKFLRFEMLNGCFKSEINVRISKGERRESGSFLPPSSVLFISTVDSTV